MEERITCLNCYHSTPYLLKQDKLMCRRFPPQSIRMSTGNIESIFPSMNPLGRCGEWKDKNPPIQQSTGPR
jgi:hypothetical protein